MHIALLAPLVAPIREPPLGGVATLLTDLAAGLVQAGHKVDVFAAAGSEAAGLSIVDTGVEARSLAPTRVRPLGPPPDERARAVAYAAFEKAFACIGTGYDLVHNHAFDAPAVELARGLPCPVVHTLHLPPDPGMLAALTRALADERPPCLAAVSDSQRAAWGHHVPIDAVLRPGIPVDRIPWSGTDGGPLVCAGRISPEKGTLEAIAIARRAGRRLVVAGNRYDPGYAAEVEREAARGGVRLAGSLERSRLWRLMAGAAGLVFPVAWEEPFGLVAAEAQAAGTPVVAFRRGALPEVVDDGVTGAVVEPGDVDRAVTAVRGLGRYDRAACRRHAERSLGAARMIRAHEALYARLLAAEPPRPDHGTG